MTTRNIKFSAKNKPDFIIELRKKVNDYFEKNKLSKYGNINMAFKSVFMFALYFIPYILMLTGVFTSILPILICWIMMGIGMAGIGMAIMHDASHGTYSGNKRINALLAKSLYLLGGFLPAWQHQHNTLHHGYTNIDGVDEDIAPIGILRFSPNTPLYRIHKYQHWYAWFFYGLMTISWVTIKDFSRLMKYKRSNVQLSTRKKYNRLFTDLILTKILYYIFLIGVPLVTLPIAWYMTLLFFFAMHVICGLILSTVFQTAHVVPTSEFPLPDENGNIENNWAIHQLLTTSDFAPKSRIFSWLIGGLNYQVEHHLFPNIGHVHYRNIAACVKDTALKYDLPYHVQPNFFRAVRSHYRMLKLLGKQESSEKFPYLANYAVHN